MISTLLITVGGQGNCPGAGSNGGGAGHCASETVEQFGGGGGGASDIRTTSNSLSSRIVVGGGGGGAGYDSCTGLTGGIGGGLVAGAGSYGQTWATPTPGKANLIVEIFRTGQGGTQAAGGAGGVFDYYNPGNEGSLGVGGEAGLGTCGGGGGGGYYGGGGAATGAGGGSSYSNGLIVQNSLGVNSGDGVVRIYAKKSTVPSLAPTSSFAPSLSSKLHCPVPQGVSTTYLPPPLVPGEVSCTSKVHSYSGTCMDVSKCLGAVFNNLCRKSSKKCCFAETTPAKTGTKVALCKDTFTKLFPTIQGDKGYCFSLHCSSIKHSITGSRGDALFYYFNEAASKVVLAGKNPSESTQCYRMAAFVAQVGHESSGLTNFEELGSGAEYEGRCKTKNGKIDLGNCNPGDGKLFKGRGAIQITGRYNYGEAAAYLNLTLLTNPELANFPSVGFAVSVWYWLVSKNLNRFATSSEADFLKLTHQINGGENGLEDRKNRWNDAKRILECK